MDLRHLRYFIAVAEEGSFLRAAQRLHISQPPLSIQIRILEDELQVLLLTRTNRGVALTPAGKAFYEDAKSTLNRLDQAKVRAQRVNCGDIGTLSVGFVSIAALSVLPPALKGFRSKFSQAEVQLHELTTDVQVRELRLQQLDLCIGLGPVEEPGIEFEPLLEEDLILALPSSHVLARSAGSIHLRELSNESFVVVPRHLAPGLFDLTMSQCRLAGFTPRITQHARQMQTVIGLVSCGMGFALVPSSVRNLKRPGVRYRSIEGRRARVELGILKFAGASSPLAEHFAEALHVACRSGNVR